MFYAYEETWSILILSVPIDCCQGDVGYSPNLVDQPHIAFKQAYHPYLLLTSNLDKEQVVPFDMELITIECY